jgi:hypothetical protein
MCVSKNVFFSSSYLFCFEIFVYRSKVAANVFGLGEGGDFHHKG